MPLLFLFALLQLCLFSTGTQLDPICTIGETTYVTVSFDWSTQENPKCGKSILIADMPDYKGVLDLPATDEGGSQVQIDLHGTLQIVGSTIIVDGRLFIEGSILKATRTLMNVEYDAVVNITSNSIVTMYDDGKTKLPQGSIDAGAALTVDQSIVRTIGSFSIGKSCSIMVRGNSELSVYVKNGLVLNDSSTIDISDLSTASIDEENSVVLNKGARLTVTEGSHLRVRSNSGILVWNNTELIIKKWTFVRVRQACVVFACKSQSPIEIAKMRALYLEQFDSQPNRNVYCVDKTNDWMTVLTDHAQKKCGGRSRTKRNDEENVDEMMGELFSNKTLVNAYATDDETKRSKTGHLDTKLGDAKLQKDCYDLIGPDVAKIHSILIAIISMITIMLLITIVYMIKQKCPNFAEEVVQTVTSFVVAKKPTANGNNIQNGVSNPNHD